jgi:hypothetical protein
MGLMAKVNPQIAQQMAGQMVQQRMGSQDPYKQAQINLMRARTNSLQSGGQSVPAAYVNDSGDVSLQPKEGYQPVTKAQLPYVGVSKSAKERDSAMRERANVWQRSIDTHQIDLLAKNTGINPKQQASIQQNTMRAFRAVPILSKKNLTYQELALGEIDLAGMMQGGVPQVDELKAVHFPGWQEEYAKLKTYATGHPAEVVPDEVRKKVLDLVQGVIKIDNRFIVANQKFNQQMLAPTIRGGIGQFNKPIQNITDMLTGKDSQENTPTATGPNGQKIKWNGSAWVPL